MNEQNPTNSTLIQGLIEAIRTHKCDNSKILEDALHELQTHPDCVAAADAAVKRRPEKNITFTQNATFGACSRQYSLSAQAYRLLGLMQSAMSTDNITRVDRDLYCEILDIKDRALRKALAELQDKSMVVCVRQQAGHHPPEYMINPRVAHEAKSQDNRDTLVRRFWAAKDADRGGEDAIKATDANFRRPAYPDIVVGSAWHADTQRRVCYLERTKKEPSDVPSSKSSPVTTKTIIKPTTDFQPTQDPELDKLFPGE